MAQPTITFQPFAPGTTDLLGSRISSVDPRLSRTNYFDGRLLKASDLIRDQVYLDERALEIGQVLGSGIVRGLELSLVDGYQLRVEPGVAVAPSGRVLQLEGRTLTANLRNVALIVSLNRGYYRRFQRGLYVVALQYAEVGADSAEAYPADLASERRFQVNSFAEGVELTLVPLGVPLSRVDEVSARAGLVREFLGREDQRPELSDEAVALGLLALEQGRPLWLDLGLVRRPLRRGGVAGSVQQDLAVHYQELLARVLTDRRDAGLTGGFAASQYFRVLPPFGPLPKETVNPVSGSQGFFPEGYEVTIAPVRRDDLSAVLRESAHLAPMDLEHDADADVMVLVPMSTQEFAWRGRSLERGAGVLPDKLGLGRLLHLDRLALRLHPLPPVHAIDTDAQVWQAIWDAAGADEVVFVRRPPRAAETGVSAVVLARGYELPKAGVAPGADTAALEKELAAALEKQVEAENALATAKEEFAKRLKEAQESPDAAVAELKARIGELEARVKELAARNKELEALLAETKGSLTAAETGRTKAVADAKTAAEARDRLVGELGVAVAERDKLVLDLDAAAKGRDKAAAELAASEEARVKLTQDLAAAGTDRAGLAGALATAKGENTKLSAELVAATAERTRLATELTSANADRSQLADQLKEVGLQRTALTEQLDAARLAQEKLSGDLTAAKANVTKLNRELKSANDTILSLRGG